MTKSNEIITFYPEHYAPLTRLGEMGKGAKVLTISGGGFLGPMAVGVVIALAEKRWYPDFIFGTSVGAVVGVVASYMKAPEAFRAGMEMGKRMGWKHVARMKFPDRRVLGDGSQAGTILTRLTKFIFFQFQFSLISPIAGPAIYPFSTFFKSITYIQV